MQGRKQLTPAERAKREVKRERKTARRELELARLAEEAQAALAAILKQDKKRRHHTIWRKHLEAWADDDGRVWCQQGALRFHPGTVNLGLQKDFYRLREMDPPTRRWVEQLVDRMPDSRDRDLARGWIHTFQGAFLLRDLLKRGGIKDADIEEAIEITISNEEEDLHADAENNALAFLDALRDGDASPLGDDTKYIHFARFLGLQYMRTPGIAMRTIAACNAVPGFDAAAAIGVLRTIFATNIGKVLFLGRNQTRLTFLENDGTIEFITGDQPVINLGKTEYQELFYPLTPVRALLVEPEVEARGVKTRRIAHGEVHAFNVRIREASMLQVYAASEATLDKLCS